MTLDVNSRPPDSQPDAERPAAAADAFTPLALRRHAADQDERDAIGRLNFLHGAGERRAALLALILTPGSAREKQAWREETAEVASAGRVRADVARLSAASRLPVFELLLQRSRNAPVAERQALVEAARCVMGADGMVRPIDRLHWLAMRHVLGEAGTTPVAASGSDNDPAGLPLASVEQFASLTAWLARLVPAPVDPNAKGAVSKAGNAWYESAMSQWVQCYRAQGRRAPACHPPDADGMAHALWAVQALSWMLKPVLLRAWVDAAVSMSAKATLLPEAADALRLLALLLDTPMPPALAEHFLEV